eukprot:685019-Rhodomonas_salina.1
MVRNVDGDTHLLESIMAVPLNPQTSPRDNRRSRSRSPAEEGGGDGSHSSSHSRPAVGGGQSE